MARRKPAYRERYHAYLRSPAWQQVRDAYYAQRPRCCARCGTTTPPLQLHHRTYAHIFDELAHLGDLECLCESCHRAQHGRRARRRVLLRAERELAEAEREYRAILSEA